MSLKKKPHTHTHMHTAAHPSPLASRVKEERRVEERVTTH